MEENVNEVDAKLKEVLTAANADNPSRRSVEEFSAVLTIH